MCDAPEIVVSLSDFRASNGYHADDHYDFLASLFEKLQLATYEASDLMTDLITFVDSVHYFALITRNISETDRPTTDPFNTDYRKDDVVGMLYLTSPSEMRNNIDGINDLNLGVIVHNSFRRKGYATQAVKIALDHAFNHLRCHRVQAIVINPFSEAKYPSYRFFTSIGFEQEGIRRHSYFNVFDNEYQDIAYMAILDIEWLTKSKLTHPTPWDELLFRHDKERQMILRWESKTSDSDDTETLHQFSLDDSSECGTSNVHSRAISRASTPGLYVNSYQQPEALYAESSESVPFSGTLVDYSAIPPLGPSSSSSRFNSCPASPASSVSTGWEVMDEYSSFDEMESDIETRSNF